MRAERRARLGRHLVLCGPIFPKSFRRPLAGSLLKRTLNKESPHQAKRRILMTQAGESQQGFRGVFIGLLTVAALLGGANGVSAQIYEWVDDANHRHYANSLELVPAEARAKAQLLVK